MFWNLTPNDAVFVTALMAGVILAALISVWIEGTK